MIEGTCLKKENLENSVAHSSFKFHFVNISSLKSLLTIATENIFYKNISFKFFACVDRISLYCSIESQPLPPSEKLCRSTLNMMCICFLQTSQVW